MTEAASYLPVMIDAALAAGAEIARIYEAGCTVIEKGDGSPVTEADHRAEAIILDHLSAAFPDVPVVAEEEMAAGRMPALGNLFFLVDPLDGTRGFINRNGEFTVNIGLIDHGTPVAGVIYVPVSQRLYYGAHGKGAFRRVAGKDEPIHVRQSGSERIAVGSRDPHAQGEAALQQRLGITDYRAASSSLKFCLIAEGEADLYPRTGPTMEWDTAAGHAILIAAGGRVMVLADGEEQGPLRYGKADSGFINPHFIARGS